MAGFHKRKEQDDFFKEHKSRVKGPSQRQQRVAEVIRHALAKIFEQKNLRNPLLNEARLTITEVNVGGDLRTATVYILLAKDVEKKDILDHLKQVKGEIRAQLAPAILLKFVPDLHFKYDNSLEYAEKIHHLLQLTLN